MGGTIGWVGITAPGSNDWKGSGAKVGAGSRGGGVGRARGVTVGLSITAPACCVSEFAVKKAANTPPSRITVTRM